MGLTLRARMRLVVAAVVGTLVALGAGVGIGGHYIGRETEAALARRARENDAMTAATALRAAMRQAGYLFKNAALAVDDPERLREALAELERGHAEVRSRHGAAREALGAAEMDPAAA